MNSNAIDHAVCGSSTFASRDPSKSPPPARPRIRRIELVRACWAAALLFAPRQVIGNIHDAKVDAKSVLIARALGARHLAQAVLSGLRPSPEVLALGVWVDAVHALTALALAGSDHSRVRTGLADAAVATTWAGTGYRDLVAATATPPTQRRRRDHLARIMLSMIPGGDPLMRRASAARPGSVGEGRRHGRSALARLRRRLR